MSDTVRISPRGQVVVPAKIRKALALEAGGELVVTLVDGTIILRPVGQFTAAKRKSLLESLESAQEQFSSEMPNTFDSVAAVKEQRR